MTVSESAWAEYVGKLRKIDEAAAEKMLTYLNEHETSTPEERQELLDYAYAVATRYGEGSAALACEMYDALAELSGKSLPAAEPAETAAYAEVAKAVNGTMKSGNPSLVSNAVGRLVKRAGADTTLKNARRDGAQFAWVPRGDSCTFCRVLASRGWQYMSAKAMKNGHAEHIHAHCDCEYCVRFDEKTTVQGYDPDTLLREYEAAEGDNSQEKINSLRRRDREENKDEINARKRAAYAEQKAREQTAKKITPSDVTAEYRASAKPGSGTITYEPGYDMGKQHTDEIAGAQWIHDTLGGDVVLLKETNGQNEKTSDYLWNGHFWDWKTVSTDKAANSAVRHGLKQIRTNPGGLLLNYADSDVEIERVISVINKRMQWNKELTVDILIIQNQKLTKALRYNEK